MRSILLRIPLYIQIRNTLMAVYHNFGAAQDLFLER